MSLKTKSIQEKRAKQDGIRICIMRRIKPEFDFDIWLPALSPSTELLKDYHDKKINWDEYEILFTKEVLETQKEFIEIIGELCKNHTISLLCWEETPEKCHRRLVAERINELFPEVKLSLF